MRFLAVSLLLAQIASPPPPASRLTEDVRRLEADSNEARFDALTGMLRERGIPFTVEPFRLEKPVGGEPRTEGRNIVVSIGEGPEEILIGAHYDAARSKDGSLSRGAVDNGASTVLLVRLAETLRRNPLSVPIRLVWFDMEELGLMGSAEYVQAHAADRIRAMLNLDINAYGDTVLFGPSTHPANVGFKRVLVETCAAQDLPCVPFPQMPPGDDRSFVKAGVPTVSLAILPAVEAHQVWLLINVPPSPDGPQPAVPPIMRTIHTAADSSEKVDPASMTRVLDLTLGIVRALAGPARVLREG